MTVDGILNFSGASARNTRLLLLIKEIVFTVCKIGCSLIHENVLLYR